MYRRTSTMILVLLAMVASHSAGQPSPSPSPPEALPEWLRDHMEFMTRDGGRWITDNSAYRSDAEPFDAYGTEWSWGIGKTGMRGRLFGLRDGSEAGTFWEFRLVWHPDRKEAVLYQFGATGVVGEGPMTEMENGTEHDQTFHGFDGASLRVKHHSVEKGDVNETQTFHWEDGEWVPQRAYVWKRQRE